MLPIEALNACGANFITRVHLGVVPQVAPNFLRVILYRFDKVVDIEVGYKPSKN